MKKTKKLNLHKWAGFKLFFLSLIAILVLVSAIFINKIKINTDKVKAGSCTYVKADNYKSGTEACKALSDKYNRNFIVDNYESEYQYNGPYAPANNPLRFYCCVAQKTNPINTYNPTNNDPTNGLISVCQSLKGKIATMYSNYGGKGIDACIRYTGKRFSPNTVNPQLLKQYPNPTDFKPSQNCATGPMTYDCGAKSKAAATVQELIKVCQSVKGQSAGKNTQGWCIKFTGKYYDTNKVNPKVTPIPSMPLSAYCSTGSTTSCYVAPTGSGNEESVAEIIARCQALKGRLSSQSKPGAYNPTITQNFKYNCWRYNGLYNKRYSSDNPKDTHCLTESKAGPYKPDGTCKD